MKQIETPIQVRFSDTDMLGHVNNINLQNFFEIGKCDFFVRVLGIPLNWTTEGLILKATGTTYEAQTRIGENLVVYTQVQRLGTKSITFDQKLHNKDTGELKAHCVGTLVAFNFVKQETQEIPKAWREAIERQ